jgi:hypothetical protein
MSEQRHTLTSNISPLNVFLNNTSAFEVYNDKISLYSGSIETSNFLVKYDSAGYEWTSNALPYVFNQNEFSNIGNNVFFKSLPYSKFGDKGSTSISETVNIVEPIANGVSLREIPTIPSTSASASTNGLEATWNDGTYTIKAKYSDSITGTDLGIWRLFNDFYKTPNADDVFHSTQIYSGTNGTYNGSKSTNFKGNLGSTIYIDLGRSIILRRMEIAPRQIYADLASPKRFKIYASNDVASWTSTTHSSWTEILNQNTDLVWAPNAYTEVGNFLTNNTEYRYFAMVITQTLNSWGYLCLAEWNIYGKLDIITIPPETINTNYKYLSFTYDGILAQTKYTVNFSEETECDILVVGGGGGGSGGIGAGGGAGGVAWIENAKLNGNFTINVGKGGNGGTGTDGAAGRTGAGTKGSDSSITNGSIIITADGGGTPYTGINNGGSGAGADGYSDDGGISTAGGKIDKSSAPSTFFFGNVSYYGTNGGSKATTNFGGGGGGGAKNNTGVNGGNNVAGVGGEGLDIINGKDLKTHFNITNTSIGQHSSGRVYFGGGGGGSGGGSTSGTGQSGGLGGGGAGASGSDVPGTPGTQNTGGGGGGGSTGSGDGGDGGSGIVIIRYKTTKGSQYQGKSQGILKYLPTPSTTSSNTGTWAIEESANTTFKSDFIRTISKDASRTIAPVNGNTIETDFLFDPDTKFSTKSNNILTNYKYNINASLVTTNSSDKIKYLFAFVYYNKPTIGAEISQAQIIKSNLDADWTISNITNDNKRYVKISVKTVSAVDSINIKI